MSELFDAQTTPDALQTLMLGDLSALATPPLVPSPKMDNGDLARSGSASVLSGTTGAGVVQKSSAGATAAAAAAATGVMNCEELERDLITPVSGYNAQFSDPPQVHRLTGTHVAKVASPPQVQHQQQVRSEQYLSLSEADRQKLSGFSVNAPEFVPRSVTPTKFSASPAQQPTLAHIAPPPPAPPPPPPHPLVMQTASGPVVSSAALTLPPHSQVKLLDSRQVVAPVVTQAFTHPPPPPPSGKVPVNRSGQFHAQLGRMSPQLIPHVAQGRHSPTPAFILPKPPTVSGGNSQSAAVAAQAAAAALQTQAVAAGAVPPGIIQYAQAPYVAFPAPPPPSQPPPPARYAPYQYTRPPFLPPGAAYPAAWTDKATAAVEKLQGRAHKVNPKDKLWAAGAPAQVYSLPTSTQSARVAANFQPNTVLTRGAKVKNEAVNVKPQQQIAAAHNKEGAALVAASGSPLQLSMEKSPGVEKVERLLQEGKRVMVILRGLPGSGKSTMAM